MFISETPLFLKFLRINASTSKSESSIKKSSVMSFSVLLTILMIGVSVCLSRLLNHLCLFNNLPKNGDSLIKLVNQQNKQVQFLVTEKMFIIGNVSFIEKLFRSHTRKNLIYLSTDFLNIFCYYISLFVSIILYL